MAGVLAMASVVEDFDTQPCKKSCKDGGSPVVKTITNYFSPVPKPVEKPFSPPRSNNIMDYFSRKTTPPQQAKENCPKSHSAEKNTNPELGKHPSRKRSKKSSKAARKLVASESVTTTSDVTYLVVEDSDADVVSSCGIFGDKTEALLSQLSAEACITTREITGTETVSDKCPESNKPQEHGFKCEGNVRPEPAQNTTDLSPRDQLKQLRSAVQKRRKRQQKEAKHPEPEGKETECDVSMEVIADETSQLNDSAVKISFEDFLRSQCEIEEDKNDVGKDDVSKISSDTEELKSEHLEMPKAEENVGPSVQISPRTVTIQAEVHVVSPKQEKAKAEGSIASIFSRRKMSKSPAEMVSSSNAEAEPQPSTSPLTGKRKSNVVLQEEDLELAVLESELAPKCSKAEKKQFMAAFKQPSMDGSKTKPVKNQGKQKQAVEKVLDAPDKPVEDDAVIQPSVEQVSQGNQSATKKPTKKGRKKDKCKKDVATSPAATAAEESVVTIIDDHEEEEPPVTSTPSVPAVRRLRGEAVVTQTPQTSPTASVRKSRRLTESKDEAIATSPVDSPVKISSPKTRRSKHDVFVAEMVSPPDTNESPIRIRFSRVHRRTSKVESGSDITPSSTTKTSSESKNRRQAKKLLEKAKVIQQSKKSTVEKETVRRSSRSKASIRNYCDDEDSVICVEEQTTTPRAGPGTSKTKKALRSLNDVLGKASTVGKDPKAVPGTKVVSLGQEKATRKVSAVISIFDESSHDGSENSQDDEQFRARREFLKSGLPESFKKQIVKTAATKEAYTLSCSSFQPVTHTTQPPSGCPLWSLPWPTSSLLCHLKQLWRQTLNPLPSTGGSLCLKTAPSCRRFSNQEPFWRPEITENLRQLLVDEFGASNPLFPARMFMNRLLKRRTDHQQQLTASEVKDGTSTSLPAEPVGVKRKRKVNDRETTKAAKKQRSNLSEEKVSPAEAELPKRGGRTRRAQRSGVTEEAASSLKSPPILVDEDSVVFLHDSPPGQDTRKKVEDVLWTDKYQPQNSGDIVGNAAPVKRLHSWLKEWKLRTDREERQNQKEKKQEGEGSDSEWDFRGEDCQDGVDMLCNTILITGPTGVGKTAAVYACAQELGFKVFEVNASSQRSGRLILSQLKEATQSHQVDSQGVNAHKPAYFNSYGTSSSAGSARPGASPRKTQSPRRVVSSPRKQPQSPRGAKKAGLAPVSLANFFKISQTSNKDALKATKNETTAASKKVTKAHESGGKQKVIPAESPAALALKNNTSEEQSKKTATSLILFEEVDVIFDDDSGFLSAIKTFMTTTKRPVILTTSDPSFSSVFDGNLEEIQFKTPSVLDVGSYLQLLCLAENIRTNPTDIRSLLKLNGCDVRQSLLQLQFWARSAGGQISTRPPVHTDINSEVETNTEETVDKPVTASSDLPLWETGCTESALGLLNIEPHKDCWQLLRSQSLIKGAGSWDLLTDSRRRGVDLLYSNMENLLPLPLTQLTTSKLCKPEPTCPRADALPSSTSSLIPAEPDDGSDSCSPIKVSSRMKNKRQRQPPDQGGLHSGSDSEDGFPSLRMLPSSSRTQREVKESVVSERVKRKPQCPEDRAKSLPVSQCLESIADFLDDMSYIDSSLLLQPGRCNAHSRMSPVGAVVKDGMTDESRVETDRSSRCTGGHVFEIQAAAEALSFHKCLDSVAESWKKVQELDGELGKQAAEELTLPVAAHRGGYSFTQDSPCQPQLVQRGREVMEDLTFKGVFGTLGNRQAAALDYLPVMRSICRSEQLKEQGKVKRRFLHYLDAIHLGLEKSTLQLLAEDFP
ncbi:ATPase family AAA domain-containing protein 5 isoform X2 [Cololabis saira]|uniref:ATPase family AAA domain-containing protein 5 isoform X2 n=1 Tax=Cololabis saira TaxID=129043 RepID=UPI002AD3388E|nr:ATPase family AAA domain-containing protein 5 isoform X2 [Cololabis saira]